MSSRRTHRDSWLELASAAWLDAAYSKHPALWLLRPLSLIYAAVVQLRRWMYRHAWLRVVRLPVPVVVVGNVTLGGTGKTPLCVYLATLLSRQGWRVGIVSRGYGGQARQWPQQVRADSDPAVVGDEAVLLARRTGLPMAVGRDRVAAAEALIAAHACDLILADDGLQHYRLGRDIEIAVIDGVRRLGNRVCLPAGPLREPASRLLTVDFKVAQGAAGRGEFSMHYRPLPLCSLLSDQSLSLESLRGLKVHAVAGTGHPERFFTLLRSLGAECIPHAFPDHYTFVATDLAFADPHPVVMTEKDAVKCVRFANARMWYLPIQAVLPELFAERVIQRLRAIKHGQETAGNPRLSRHQGTAHPG